MAFNANEMALLAACLNDADGKAMLKKIIAATKEQDDATARAKEAQTAANATLAQAQALVAGYTDKEAGLDQREATLNEVNVSLNNEKILFESVRQKVDAEQAELKLSLEQREGTVTARESAATATDADLTVRASVIAAGEESLEIRHANLRAAMQANYLVASVVPIGQTFIQPPEELSEFTPAPMEPDARIDGPTAAAGPDDIGSSAVT